MALNLAGVDRDEVERGQWVVKDPSIEPTYLADVRLSLLPDAPAPLSRVLRARVDHGTAEILAKVVLADRETLSPGESCYAQLRFEERALVYPGDHFIVRSITPVTTLGGGEWSTLLPTSTGRDRAGTTAWCCWRRGPSDAVAALLCRRPSRRA